MGMSARLAPDHQIIPHALEVLRLMNGCLVSNHVVDCDELRSVLAFLKDAADCDKVRALLKELTENGNWTAGNYLADLTQLYIERHGDVIFDLNRFRLKRAVSYEFMRLLYRLESKYIEPHCI